MNRARRPPDGPAAVTEVGPTKFPSPTADGSTRTGSANKSSPPRTRNPASAGNQSSGCSRTMKLMPSTTARHARPGESAAISVPGGEAATDVMGWGWLPRESRMAWDC